MSVFNVIEDFLPKKTKLMVLVKPSEDVDEELKRWTVRDIKVEQQKNPGVYVPIYLEESLKIEFSISRVGTITKILQLCRCSTPVLPNKQMKSLNQACTEISKLFERHRISNSNNVHKHCYFENKDGFWELLNIFRDKIYQPFKNEFEKQQRIINEKRDIYVKPLVESKQLFISEFEQKNELIDVLQSENKNLQKRLFI